MLILLTITNYEFADRGNVVLQTECALICGSFAGPTICALNTSDGHPLGADPFHAHTPSPDLLSLFHHPPTANANIQHISPSGQSTLGLGRRS